MKFEKVVVQGEERAAELAAMLVKRSQFFAITPLPDGEYEFQVKAETRELLEEALKNDPFYTVVLLYPDYCTDDFGADIFVDGAKAPDPYVACEIVRNMASRAQASGVPPEDFRPIGVILGDVQLALDASNFG